MSNLQRWKIEVTVSGGLVKTLYEMAKTKAEALSKARKKLRGAFSHAGAFKFTATKVDAPGVHHATKYGKKASEKIARTMHEFKRGKLRSSSGGKVTSRAQAIAIGISQARARGYKVPAVQGHAIMSLDERVRSYLSKMRPGQEINASGIAHALGGVNELAADYALERAAKAGLAITSDGRWFGPAGGDVAYSAKTPVQLDREIAEILTAPPSRGKRAVSSSHAKKKRQPRLVAYRLQLLPSEMRAIEFAQGRYAWPDMLAAHMSENGLVEFTESEMWSWADDVDRDTEGGHSPFPLAAGDFAEKLQRFYDARI